MEVVTGAMSTLLPKLGSMLKDEYNLHRKVRGEILFLTAELERMEAALVEVSEAPIDHPPSKLVKLWAKDVKDLSYEIEDSVDKFMVQLDGRAEKKAQSFMGFIHRSMDLLTRAKTRHKIGTEVKHIKSLIKEVSARRDRYKVDKAVVQPVVTSVDSLRLSALYKKETELVGTEEKIQELVETMTEGADEASKQHLKIVSIVGFGGLGKTTLANVVYQKLKSQFDCGAFVSVSLNPNMEKIFKNILHQLDKHKYGNINEVTWGEAQLISELRDFLLNKRYFIVIDDIWNISVWKTIKHAFTEDRCGSRIITTTRILDVAKQVGSVYDLKPLSLIDSRKLFHQRIFGVEDNPPTQLAEVSEKILKRCGGVPLAIMTTASILASKRANDWSRVYQSMGSGSQDSSDMQDMRRILSVSYYELPAHLKTCLLFISVYPEDYTIVAEDLIWQWIGEGFVQEEHGKSLYEVGEEYFAQLINKSLIQPVDIGSGNKASTCRVHDMVLDLITSLSSEENFLTIVGGLQPVSASSKIHRLSVQTRNEDDLKNLATMSLSHVRSLFVFGQDINLLPALSSFPVIRSLDLSYCLDVDNHHVKIICNLLHLRYLRLCNTSITQIPEEIGNLQFLQVLDISQTGIEVLPPEFVRLRRLVYLHIDRQTKLPDQFGSLKSLQDFPVIPTITSPSMLHDVGKLTKLRSLLISFDEWNESYEGPFCQCLSNLVNLRTIKIIGAHLGTDSRSDYLSPPPLYIQSIHLINNINCALPRWMSSLSCLSFLTIHGLRTLRAEDLQVLGSIPSLNYLDIWVVEPTQERQNRLLIDSGHPFPCLTTLKVASRVMELRFSQGAMQKLQTLKLRFSARQTLDQFGDLDFGLENVSSLEHVYVGRWSKPEPGEVEAAETAVREALGMNPNQPTLEFSKWR
nr:NBS-LRR disease resistance protein [Dasypyrum villosum]